MIDFRREVQDILINLEELLVSKNEKYGNSALEPKRVFSSADTVEQLKVRIDDKLSRMSAGTNDNEDTVTDLMGYLVLLKIAEQREERLYDDDDVAPEMLFDDEHQANIDKVYGFGDNPIFITTLPNGEAIINCNGNDSKTVFEILSKGRKIDLSKLWIN